MFSLCRGNRESEKSFSETRMAKSPDSLTAGRAGTWSGAAKDLLRMEAPVAEAAKAEIPVVEAPGFSPVKCHAFPGFSPGASTGFIVLRYISLKES